MPSSVAESSSSSDETANHEKLHQNLPQNPQQDVIGEGPDLGHQLPLDIPPDLQDDMFEKDLHHVMLHPHHQDLQKAAIAVGEDQVHQRADPLQEMVDLLLGVSGHLPGGGDLHRGKVKTLGGKGNSDEKAYLQCERENNVTVPAMTIIVSGIDLGLCHLRGGQSEGALDRVLDHEVLPEIPTHAEMSGLVRHHHGDVKDVTVLTMHDHRDVVDHGHPFTQDEGRGLVPGPGFYHEVLQWREIRS
ncbi:hypothetical protein ANCDUO_07078 [Ancylostoma duodenale]|uniref:Uncharacterized protein n=1 Tax=Ancylostoma duodenale TaxID=51022 RepID=A0A0C2GUH2_9BILA|nr:hypothetical protein ANCDUO_07078 [Ancylostoma duodenale]